MAFRSLSSCLSVSGFCVQLDGTDLEGGDDDVGRVDTDGNGGGVGLFNVNSVDVDDPFLSVDLECQYGQMS